MKAGPKYEKLENLLDQIDNAAHGKDRVSLRSIIEAVGSRSFGPLLLLAGLIVLAPLVGDVPGMPTLMGMVVLFTVSQLLFGRKHIWLPDWILKRSVSHEKLQKAVQWLHKPVRFVDRLLRPRLRVFTHGAAVYVTAVTCMLVALMMPAMELVPFSANGAGLALTAFGLALVTRDGLLSLIAFLVTAGTIGGVTYALLF